MRHGRSWDRMHSSKEQIEHVIIGEWGDLWFVLKSRSNYPTIQITVRDDKFIYKV